MKTILSLLLLICSLSAVAQFNGVTATPQSSDSIRVVFRKNTASDLHSRKPSIYINGKLMPFISMAGINTDDIKSVTVKKNTDETEPNGAIYLETKKPDNIKLISLNEINRKYVDSKGAPALYMFDGDFIYNDPEICEIDENNILSIEVINTSDFASMRDIPVNFNLIKILSRSKANLEKANQIMIRGELADAQH